MTGIYNFQNPQDVTIRAADQVVGAGATGSRVSTASPSNSEKWVAQLVALRAAATVTVNKIVLPNDDSGKFNLKINGTTHAANVGHGGTTGKIAVPTTPSNSVTVSETEGTSTSFDDYISKIVCDSSKGSIDPGTSHTFTIDPGQDVICTITNTRKATLTVNKVVAPTDDAGRFNLQIDGATAGTGGNVGHGGTTGAIKLAPGNHTVGETAQPGTSLDDYVQLIGGDCAADGTITLQPAQVATCTITNTRNAAPPQPALLYLHNNPTPPTANTVAQANLPLDGTAPTETTLFNYNTTHDNNPGVTGRSIDKAAAGEELTTTDLHKVQTWRTAALGSDLTLNGSAQLRIWAKMKAPGKNIQLRAYLRECTGTTEASCTTVATGTMSTVIGASSTSFTELTLSFGSINTTIDTGNRLQIRVVMIDVANADPAYLAYDTTPFAARLTVN